MSSDWSKKKLCRDILLENFVIQKSIQFQLSRNVSIHLFSLILIGLVFKVLTIRDFVISGNHIVEINGFLFQPGRVFVTKHLFKNTHKSRYTPHHSEYPGLMSSYWGSYLQDYDKFSFR